MPAEVATNTEVLIEVTAGSLRESQLYITPFEDWLPADCVGDSRIADGVGIPGVPVMVELAGLPEPAPMDVSFHPARLVPRPYFRRHSPVRQFYRMHGVQAGDLLRATRLGDRSLRVEPTDLKGSAEADQLPPLRLGERATELPAAATRAAPRMAAPLPRDLLDAIRHAHEGKRRPRELEWLVGQALAYLGYPADALQHRLGEPDLPLKAESGLLAVMEVRKRLRLRSAILAAVEAGRRHATDRGLPWVIATDAVRYLICRVYAEQPTLDRCLVGSFDLLDFSVSDVAALDLLRPERLANGRKDQK